MQSWDVASYLAQIPNMPALPSCIRGGPPKSIPPLAFVFIGTIPLGFAAPMRLALANQEQKHTTRTTVTGQEMAWRTALHPGLAIGQKQKWRHQPSQPHIHPLPHLLVPPLPQIQFIIENYHAPSFKKFWTQMRSLPWPPQILSQQSLILGQHLI